MPPAQSLLPEFDHEMANTRKLLAVVPDAAAAWRPHERSCTLGGMLLPEVYGPTADSRP